MKENIILTKTYKFAIRIVNLYKYLKKEKKGSILSKQLLRSGTSIGANSEEGAGAQTDKDFYTKFSIAYKEARESHYWIRLLRDTGDLDIQQSASLLSELDEILKILASILATTRKKINSAKKK